MRDIEERGRDLEHVLTQYTTLGINLVHIKNKYDECKDDIVKHHSFLLVKPAFEEFCIPTKKFADVIVPRGADNTVAINLIVQHIRVTVNFSFS